MTRIAQRERDKQLLDAMHTAFAALRRDQANWQRHLAETEAWDDAAADG